jgi:hypothetical protein
VSNRVLQQQVWAIEDAQTAVKAANDLRDAWAGVGNSIADEVKRIRGLADADTGAGFATLQGRFNAAIAAGRAGDMDAAKSLPGLSQALLASAEQVATSKQELDRVRAQTAASLESAGAVMAALAEGNPLTSSGALAAAGAAQAAATTSTTATDSTAEQLRQIREELAGLRRDNNSGHAANASANQRTARILEDVSAASGGDALAVANGG